MSTYSGIKEQLKKYQEFKPNNMTAEEIRRLKYNFKSEQTKVWAAAAKKIGELAAGGNQELKEFLEEMLINKENLHRQRHALTALGSYYGYSEENTKFEILDDYSSNDQNKSIITVGIQDYFNSLFEQLFLNYRRNYLLPDILLGTRRPQNKEELEFLQQELSANKFSQDVIKGKSRAAAGKYGLNKIDEINSYKDLVLAIANSKSDVSDIADALAVLRQEDDGFIKQLIEVWYPQQEFLENLTVDNFDVKRLQELFAVEEIIEQEEDFTSDINLSGWHLISLNLSLDAIYSKKPEGLKYYLKLLLEKIKQDSKYMVNLPYFFNFLAAERPTKVTDFRSNLDDLIAGFRNDEIEIDLHKLYFSQFYLDLSALLLKIEPSNQKIRDISIYISLPEDIALNYNKVRDNKRKLESRQLIEEVKKYFREIITWKSLSKAEKNTAFVFDLLMKDSTIQLKLKDKLEIILAEKDKWLTANETILKLLVREIKFLYFEMLNEESKISSYAEFQAYSIINLVDSWNWGGTIDKDIASILINVFDKLYYEGYSDEELKEKLFKLMFITFSKIPEGKIISEMLNYSKNKGLENLFNIYQNLKNGNHDFNTLIKNIKNHSYIPQRIKDLYINIFSNVLALEKNYQAEKLNIFNIRSFVSLESQPSKNQIREQFLNLKYLEEDNLLQEFILTPIYRYQFIKDRELLFDILITGGKNSDLEEEIQVQVNKKCINYINDLKDIINSLKNLRDDYLNAFRNEKAFSEINNLSSKILADLDKYQELVNLLPYFERNYIFSSINNARDIILENNKYVSQIETAINREDEEELITILNDKINSEWQIKEGLKKRYKDIIYSYFLERGMFEEYNKQILNEKECTNLDKGFAMLNNCLINIKFVTLIILLPFLWHVLAGPASSKLTELKVFKGCNFMGLFSSLSRLKGELYFVYLFVVGIAVFLATVGIVFVKIFKALKYNRRYKTKFFLPKLMGVIFVVYLNFALSDDFLVITHNINLSLKIMLIIIYLAVLYYFLDKFQYQDLEVEQAKKRKRIYNTISIGLFYSFVINLLLSFTYSSGLFLRNISEITEINKIVLSLGTEVTNLNMIEPVFAKWVNTVPLPDLIVLPEVLIFWTVQMLFIAVILEFFLQKEKVFKRE